MIEIRLPEQAGIVNLGNGIAIHSRGLAGSVYVDAGGPGARDLAGGPLALRLTQAGLRPGPLLATAAPPGAGTPSLSRLASRSLQPGAADAPSAATVTIDVDVPDGEACVLLVEDGAGCLHWVVPEEPFAAPEAAARSLGRTVSFPVPADTLVAAEGTRGLLGRLDSAGARVQAWFFAATDAVLGPVIHGFARKWETQNRPCFTRGFTPSDYRIDDPHFARLDDAAWRALAAGPALLFVHGTFSSSGAFQGLQPAVMQSLAAAYGGRMFAFNHPTMTADPRENAIAFLSQMPQDLRLEVDIVCHSRGGLVARQMAALGSAGGRLKVRRIVFVGATNAGTALANGDHMVDMVSRFTTLARFIPEGVTRTVVDALVLAVKVAGHGLLADLEGLRAMDPSGKFMRELNVPAASQVELFAIASNFEPKAGTPFISLRRAEDLAADQVFGSDQNDLVVPTQGVFSRNGATGFPIAETRLLNYTAADGVVHTGYFDEARTGERLLEWLAGGSRAAAAGSAASGATAAEVARMFDAMRDRAVQQLTTTTSGGRALARGGNAEFTPAELEKLRPHVVNLSEGVFKASGIYSSTPQDVDAMVQEHIPRFAEKLPAGQKLRIVVWAHGGLIGERDGLRIAQKHIDWWLANGVFPIYVVWETGLFDALRSILEQVRRKLPGMGGRDLFDYTSDPLLELGAHALGGVSIWGAMKRNAELASGADGGARLIARRLADLAASDDWRRGREVEFHAVGHSAGSIFHSWFLPAAVDEKMPAFKTLQLLAPAITVAEFDSRLAGRIGPDGAAERAILYTMKRSYEEDDNCAGIYRKSLLYLIHHALEPQVRTPILGLELSLRADPAAASLFGLNGAPNAAGRVVWSVSEGDGRNSSRSQSHGDFDDDSATMNSVAANLLDEANARCAYVDSRAAPARGLDLWPVSDDWLRGVDTSAAAAPSALAPLAPSEPPAAHAAPATVRPPPSPPAPAGGGARRALCIGIDAYPAPNTLSGCVDDTRTWQRTLTALGFEVASLCDKDASHQAIVETLGVLVRDARAGDTLVVHYSGHGTQVDDFDGDEDDGLDEALVPIDFQAGAFLVDDDLRDIFRQLPPGVDLTCFIDCCHSGTITRMLGRSTGGPRSAPDTRARLLKHTDDWQDWMRAHERFRQRQASRTLSLRGSRALENNAIGWVNFSACASHELAYESGGSGDFTRHTTALLTRGALQLSNRAFQDAVIQSFGAQRRQTPQLDCPDAQRDVRLLKFLR
ncbi:hypothetical protein GT347_27025 [Xylophilus rhododendri]|uniref:Caspase domain-containing protein n=1 Tax=Xylophilus rhododendri TaxID=2697032 RepID=A0A857JEU2_9BURK|nr:caspase family protein [Xylophilus rhododendri]QHJ01319.1 hypothetical protein GT347_27025 [Xylophilus rhododendri]